MTKEIKLNAQSRNGSNSKVKKANTKDFIPAILYGPGIKNQSLKINKLAFDNILTLAGGANLIDLIIDKKKTVKVLIKDVQKDIIRNSSIHVDFYQVNMNKKVTTEVPLNFIGETKALKELGGTLVKDRDSIEIECLPGDLINQVDVELSGLKSFNDTIRLKDIKLPPNITPMGDDNVVLISLQAPRIEKEVEEAEEKETEEEEVEKEGEEGKELDTEKETSEKKKME